ncbi:hypothetical protein D0Y50_16840 [Salinimonas sediminis]|uniref:Uncharacterized protein n=1 Tax=Salinimonas sediminis TaxID=2303538 RepID=A0A346NQS1_9ALTE|nr:hypothetical protein D0Y50_16840 [Salinimonas sediminis]
MIFISIKEFSLRCISITLAAIALMLISADTHAQVKLGASQLPTYVDNEGEPARLNSIVTEAFARMEQTVELSVMRPAFLGSSVLGGSLDGEYAFLDLDHNKSSFSYSASYLPVYLYAVSKKPSVKEVVLLPHLKDERIAVENRFANTDKLRLIKDIKWARNPSTFDAFRQLADNRAYYLMTSRLLVDEFNRLLRSENEELVHLSAQPLVTAGFHLALSGTSSATQALLKRFDKTISNMQQDGTYNRLLGIDWLTKDLDDDGVADFISSADMVHTSLNPTALSYAFALDGTKASQQSHYYVDGTLYEDAQAAFAALAEVTQTARPSLLDEEVYQRVLQRW